MPENTESGRIKNWDDGETEKKRKSCSRQNGVGRKPETKEASAAPAEWIPKTLHGRALLPSPGLAPNGARYRGCPPFQAYPPAAQLDSKTEVQPTGMRTTHSAPTRMAAGRVSASKMSARGVATPAAVLRRCRREQTRCRHQNQNYARRPHKEGNSFGQGRPHPQGIYFQFTPVRVPGGEYGAEGNRTFSWLQNYRRLLTSFRSARKSW